jgi:hypothetical protein
MAERIFAGVLLAVCLAVACCDANAQVDQHRFEVGGLLTSITLTDFQSGLLPDGGNDRQVAGIGGRFTYNLNKNFAIDAEGNFFPESHLLNEEFAQKMQGLIGIKAGVRQNRFGIFAKARPGVMWFGEFQSRGSCNAFASFGVVCSVDHEKDFVMDVGGVFEFYPADRVVIRGDLGDTIIRYQSRVVGTLTTPVLVPAQTKNNLQVSLGVGWRF